MSRACWRTSSCVSRNFGCSDPGWRETLPPYFKRIINSPMKFIKCTMLLENKTGNVVSTFRHQEIPRRNTICSVTAWPFLRSKNCLPFFFQGNTYCYFICLFFGKLQMSFAFAIIFAECHGLSRVHVRASWYKHSFEFHCVVSGLGV